MNRRLNLVNDLCYILMEILIMTILFLFLQALVNRNLPLRYTGIILIGLLAFINYFLIMYCKNFLLFLIGHFALFGIIFIAGLPVIDTISFVLLTVFLLLASIEFWKTEIVTSKQILLEIPLFAIIVFIAIEIICRIQKLNQLLPVSFSLGLTFIVLYFIRYYLTNMLKFIYGNVDSRNTPFRKIFIMNSTCIGIFLLSSVATILMINVNQMSKVSVYLFGWIKYLFIALMRLISHLNTPDSLPETDTIENPTVTPTEIPTDFITTSELNPIINFIVNAISFLCFTAFIILLIYLIYRGFKALMKRYLPKSDAIEYTETIYKAYKKGNTNKRNNNTSLFTFKTNNQKIRKIYFKKIKDYKDSQIEITPYDTPGEINKKILAKTNDSVDTLTDVYEQARYGEDELTKNDVQKAKDARL